MYVSNFVYAEPIWFKEGDKQERSCKTVRVKPVIKPKYI